MRKAEFMSFVDTCIGDKYINFLVVAVKGVAEAEELIINPKVNMQTKREYYDKAYDEYMQLKANPNIKITYVAGLERISQIEEDEEIERN